VSSGVPASHMRPARRARRSIICFSCRESLLGSGPVAHRQADRSVPPREQRQVDRGVIGEHPPLEHDAA
jgi:hypothetical protein